MPQGLLRELCEIIACQVLAWSMFFPSQGKKNTGQRFYVILHSTHCHSSWQHSD